MLLAPMEEHVMNMEIKVDRRLSDQADETPIGLPGETAPEIEREEDEQGIETDDRAKGGLKAAVAKFLASFSKSKSDVADEETAANKAAAVNVELSEGQAGGEGSDAPDEDAAQRAKKTRDRQWLFVGVSAVAVAVVAAASVVFLPAGQKRMLVAEPGMVVHPTVLAPAASLASVPKPEIQAPAPQTRIKGVDPMQELLALKPSEPAPAEPTKKAEPAPQAPTQTVASAEAEKPKADGQAVKTVASGGEPARAKADADPGAAGVDAGKKDKPIADAVVASKPAQDAVAKDTIAPVKEPAAAVVKDPDRVEAMRKETVMLERMTQMAALIAHLNGQVNRLEGDLAKLAATTEERSADLQRRVALAESNRQMDAATRAQDPRNSEPLSVAPAKEPKPPVVIKTGAGAGAVAAAPVETSADKRAYRIQAASPSLAMLGTGGNDAPLEVVPGSTVPGWGRVAKIEQRGQSWVVVTSGGVIK